VPLSDHKMPPRGDLSTLMRMALESPVEGSADSLQVGKVGEALLAGQNSSTIVEESVRLDTGWNVTGLHEILDAKLVRAWFESMNPEFGDQSPAALLRGQPLDDVAPCSAKQVCPLAVETGGAYHPGRGCVTRRLTGAASTCSTSATLKRRRDGT